MQGCSAAQHNQALQSVLPAKYMKLAQINILLTQGKNACITILTYHSHNITGANFMK